MQRWVVKKNTRKFWFRTKVKVKLHMGSLVKIEPFDDAMTFITRRPCQAINCRQNTNEVNPGLLINGVGNSFKLGKKTSWLVLAHVRAPCTSPFTRKVCNQRKPLRQRLNADSSCTRIPKPLAASTAPSLCSYPACVWSFHRIQPNGPSMIDSSFDGSVLSSYLSAPSPLETSSFQT